MKRTNTALATCLVLLFAATALGTPRTWDNGDLGDSYWSSALNWSDNTIPVCGDTALITGSPATGPTVTVYAACSGLAMSGTSTLTVNNGITLDVDGVFGVNSSASVTINGNAGTINAEAVSFASNASYTISGVTLNVANVAACD